MTAWPYAAQGRRVFLLCFFRYDVANLFWLTYSLAPDMIIALVVSWYLPATPLNHVYNHFTLLAELDGDLQQCSIERSKEKK